MPVNGAVSGRVGSVAMARKSVNPNSLVVDGAIVTIDGSTVEF
jgi:hypothetical protein